MSYGQKNNKKGDKKGASFTQKRGFRHAYAYAYVREDIAYCINRVSYYFWRQWFWLIYWPETGCIAKNVHEKCVVLDLHILISSYNFHD